MMGVKTISVMPLYKTEHYSQTFFNSFKIGKVQVHILGDPYYRVAQIITNEMINAISRINRYSLIDSSMLFDYDKKDYGKVVDVFIIGEINKFSIKDSQDEKDDGYLKQDYNDKNNKNDKNSNQSYNDKNNKNDKNPNQSYNDRNNKNDKNPNQSYNDKNNKNEKRYYNRDVSLEFSYRYIRDSTGAILGVFNK
jgi:hypothetical protein